MCTQLENAFSQVHAFKILKEPQQVEFKQEVRHQQMTDQQFQLAQPAISLGQQVTIIQTI